MRFKSTMKCSLLNLIVIFELSSASKFFSYRRMRDVFRPEKFPVPSGEYLSQVLVCPIINKELEKELLCGMPQELSTSNIMIYTRTIELNKNLKVSFTCADIIVKNSNLYLNTDFMFNGKCFTNGDVSNFPTEIFWDHEVMHEVSQKRVTTRVIKDSSTLFEMNLPPLKSRNYFYEPTNGIVGSLWIENFVEKYKTNRIPYPFCQEDLRTNLANYRNNYQDAFFLQLPNLDSIQISDKFGFELGFKSGLNKEDFQQDLCVAAILYEGKGGKDTSISYEFFVNSATGNISRESIAKNLPYPVSLLDSNVKNLGRSDKFYNFNDRLMDFVYFY